MNAVEIEEAVTALASEPFDEEEFPYQFLLAFGNKPTTIKRLKSGSSNKSDMGGVLQTNNIHIAVVKPGAVTQTLLSLKESPATTKAKAKFILATDGEWFEAEDMQSGDTVACEFKDFPDHFGFFLILAGISTVKQIRDSSFDIRATSRLNKLYVELLRQNPEWGTDEQRHEMNHFMARLIFCFFAEDTDIFRNSGLFTNTVDKMSERDASNTHEVISEMFRAMNLKFEEREQAGLPRWADVFPYVNGGLFSGSLEVPIFNKIARAYLIHIGNLDWTQINPDIFGSMIQAVADEEERGALGMHYTSVPNILKLLNPLFLDDIREKLDDAGDSSRKLLNLRNRIARIRHLDPAAGSGNCLVIAYKQLRDIENTINQRRGERGRKSDIPITNFRGIELRDFSAEIARLSLIIAEYQCDVLYRGQQEALDELLPLSSENWITCGNALKLDWLSVCRPSGIKVNIQANDLFETPSDKSDVDFENEGGETYIYGNPPYLGSTWQSKEQKAELQAIFEGKTKNWKSLDYVSGWFMKAAEYGQHTNAAAAFVSTNSICQGQQVPILWPAIYATEHDICFAYTSFKWSNLASNKAGVTVVIVGISNRCGANRHIFERGYDGTVVKVVDNINAYLVPGPKLIIDKLSKPISDIPEMDFGSKPVDGGNLFLNYEERERYTNEYPDISRFIREYSNSDEFINGKLRYCLWIDDKDCEYACNLEVIRSRLNSVSEMRITSSKIQTQRAAEEPHKFAEIRHVNSTHTIVIPRVSSESRQFLPVGLVHGGTIIGDRNFALYDAPLWTLSLIASRLHLIWIGTVCVRMRTDYSYSNTLGWNTFPVPGLTDKNRTDLTRCAENILLAREAHFPATIADLYVPENMPDDLRHAHEVNDEVLERIYIGRRFKNDTERLEKLFDLYTKMTAAGNNKNTQIGLK